MGKVRQVLKLAHDGGSRALAAGGGGEWRSLTKPCVGVFWDLDNKPPKAVPPYDAATRLKDVAAAFGEVVETVAYANHHAFSHVPGWVREQRLERRKVDLLERTGILKAAEAYVCEVCGAKQKTHAELRKHFKSLHEREQQKRMRRLATLKGGKKAKYLAMVEDKSSKFRNAARNILVPKVGYGLAGEIRRAGFLVRTVPDAPQAADIALNRHMLHSMKQGVSCICLVSDDSDFSPTLQFAQEQEVHTVVVGETSVLRKHADLWFSWQDVASGLALVAASETGELWMSEDAVSLGQVFGPDLGGSLCHPSDDELDFMLLPQGHEQEQEEDEESEWEEWPQQEKACSPSDFFMDSSSDESE